MYFAWMGWTWQTALFFTVIGALLLIMTVLAVLYPEKERVGILRIPTTRGDRLFISLLGAAFINIAWIGFMGPNPYWALGLSFAYAAAVFRYV